MKRSTIRYELRSSVVHIADRRLIAECGSAGKQNCPGFNFTSIQVNKNYQSGLHVDRNNLGKSMIVGLGDYKDGGLWVHMKGEVDLRKTWYEFDGNVPHCTLPYSGTRYTLIYFIQQSYRKLGRIRKDKNQDKRLLESLGFELPTNVTKLDYEPKNIRMLKGKVRAHQPLWCARALGACRAIGRGVKTVLSPRPFAGIFPQVGQLPAEGRCLRVG